MLLPAAEWMPDQPELGNPGSNVVVNLLPRSAGSYAPFSGLAPFSSTSLDGPCLGATSAQNIGLAPSLFAGSSDKLYRLTGGSTAWADVSLAGGYTTATDEKWRFSQFKDTILATNYSNAIQVLNLSTGTLFATLSADAPKARHIAVIKTHVMVANTVDPVGGVSPQRFWWSGENLPASWPVPGSSDAQLQSSDYNDIVGPMGEITGLVGTLNNADGVALFARGIRRITFVGPPDIFDFSPAEGVRGTRASQAIVQAGGYVYYPGEDGFYAFDGIQSVPIGSEKIDKWFFGQLDQSRIGNIIGAADVINKVVLWLYPSTAGGGASDSILGFHWSLNRWFYAKLNAQWIFRLLSFGVSIDQLASTGYPKLDSLPWSLDSRILQGGKLLLGGVDNDGRLAYFTGAAQQAQLVTTEVQPSPGRRTFVNGSRPLVDGAEGVTVALGTRDRLADAVTWGPDVLLNEWGECPQLVEGRYVRARVTIPAGASWSHVLGTEIDGSPGGK